jgi:hypothetical protein
MGGEGGTKDPPPQKKKKRDAWKKLRKEINKFLKHLIVSTDCSKSMGLQSVIKIRCKTSKKIALHASPYKGSTPYSILLTLKIVSGPDPGNRVRSSLERRGCS